MFTNGGHAASMTGVGRPAMSRMDEMKRENQKEIDKIATELIRGNFEIQSYEITRSLFSVDTTKLSVIIGGMKSHEVEITIKG